ncbi:family 2 encapsulin nanocompartment cargo protein terpene cyclase [Nocardia barduliensis]|uniref:family 2 encapsulin nanocompartment cargo protein terpene cyclase n=1 Tax=Nocardia barduliensis TaxID=2736643 RepID=UPI0015749F71|nr:family 2 encapsulin nanocompartment cargo protein terpene cyclase [Nocardia barduliensis]
MSVLSRAAAAQATNEVAATVVALLTNTRTSAPSELFPADASGTPDIPSPAGQPGAAPRHLLGPSGLGSAALLLPLRSGASDTFPTAAHTSAPQATNGGAGAAAASGGVPGSIAASGRLRLPTAPRIPTGPTGLGTASALLGAHGVAALAPTAPVPRTGRPEPEAAGDPARIPRGPTGLGTATVQHDRPDPIPPLYCPPPLRDDPVLAEAVNTGIVQWAKDIGLYEGRLDELRDADFGRLIMLAHPDCDDADKLLAAAKCAVSEWSVDDYYCEEDADDRAPDGTPSSAEAELGPRLELAAAAMDPAHLPARYAAQLEAALEADPILRAFRTSFDHLARYARPAQLARLRTEIAGWFIALGAEAGWRAAGRMPPVWEYLTNRQPHSFLPCMAPTDVLGGYELQAAEYTDPAVRRVVTTAALASQMVNDLYSMAREDLSNGREFNLPTVLAAEERCSRREAVLRTAEVHDELVHRFEREAAPLAAAGSPELRRFLAGLWAWMGGNRAWHADSKRYRDPH